MTAMILQYNGEVVNCSTWTPLITEENTDEQVLKDMQSFINFNEEYQCERFTSKVLKEISISDTPIYLQYTDNN